MKLTIEQAADRLKQAENILILCHQSPDGDTMGSAFAMYHALTQLGKRSRVECADSLPEKFSFLFEGYCEEEFEPGFVLAVDVADEKLLGAGIREKYPEVDLCIDHHPSNTAYAEELLLEADSAATAEIIPYVIRELGAVITPRMANCIYTGIATDTGCFKFSNTMPRSHRMAAAMMELGADVAFINELVFDTKTKNKLAFEKCALDALEYYFEDRCALIPVTIGMMERCGVTYEEIDDIASIPRQIEGVEVGITLKQRDENGYKISLRTKASCDASAICRRLGGGGHARAAGCAVDGTLEEVKQKILAAVSGFLGGDV